MTVIASIRHKGLKRYYETGAQSGIQSEHASRLRIQLAALDSAPTVEDIDLPDFRLHPLQGRHRGRWSIRVGREWHLTFEFREGNVYLNSYEDYH